MAALLKLDDFSENKPEETPVECLPGFAEGFAAGLAQAKAAEGAFTDALVQSVTDMSFTFAEAEFHILQSLGPLFDAMISRLLPEITESVFHGRLLSLLMDAAREDVRQPVLLGLCPAQMERLGASLPLSAGRGVHLHGDPDLSENQAVLARGDTRTMLDVAALTDAMKDILAAIFDETDKGKVHGT